MTRRQQTRTLTTVAALLLLATALTGQTADDLVTTLGSADADLFAKADACRQLAAIGGPEAVPALAALLPDEKLNTYARSALQAIGGPEAADALIAAADELDGALLIGVIDSLGAIHDPRVAEPLEKLARSADDNVACAALAALGKVPTIDARETLVWALAEGSADRRAAAATAALECADLLMMFGRRAHAVQLLYRVREADVPEHARLAATCRTMVARRANGVPMLREQLASDDPEAWVMTIKATSEMPQESVTEALTEALPEADPRLQAMIIRALMDRSSGIEWLPTVKPYLDSEDYSVQRAAATAVAVAATRIADAGDTDVGAALLERAASLPIDRETLAIAASTLRSHGVTIDLAAREGFITHWCLLGPVGTHDGLLDTDAVPTDRPIDTSESILHEGKALPWRSWRSDESGGRIDLLSALASATDTAAYAYAEIESAEAQDVLLKIGTDDDGYVWLNGELVYRSNTPRGVVVDQDVVEGTLVAGTNTILVKALNGTSDWGLVVRVTDRDGRPLMLEQADLPAEIGQSVEEADLEFVSLFDGTSFDGWEGDTETAFRIEDGAIVGGSLETPMARNEFLCTTRTYENFVLRLECKVVNANGGIQFRSSRVPDSAEMSGYQADMDTPGTYWGCLYDESRRGMLVQVDSETIQRIVKQDDWNAYEIRCEGPRIRLSVNGNQTVDYAETDPSIPREGLIGVQVHAGDPSETWYRNITIAELP